MRGFHSAAALVLASTIASAQECPPGYAKSGKIEWVSCEIKGNPVQCGEILVPKDWTQPTTSEKFKLRLVRYPAAEGTTNPKSIIMNPGGPGDSGISMVVDGGWSYQETVGESFHIIGFDPR
jgi:hypothetical protein